MTPRLDPDEMMARALVDPTRNGFDFPSVVAMCATSPRFVERWARVSGITLVEGQRPTQATIGAFIAYVHDFYWCRSVPPEGERWSNVEPFEVDR